jgi:phage-related protein
MPAISEVFLRIRVDKRRVREDVEAGIRTVDTTSAGVAAGVKFGEGVKRGADGKLRDLKGKLISDAEAAASGERAGRVYGDRFGRAARNAIERHLKAIKGPGTGLLGVGGRAGLIGGGIAGAAALGPAALALGGVGIAGLGAAAFGALGAKTLIGSGDPAKTAAAQAQVTQAQVAAQQAQARLVALQQTGKATPAQLAAARTSVANAGTRVRTAQGAVTASKADEGPLFNQAQVIGKTFKDSLSTAALGILPAMRSAFAQIVPLIHQLTPGLTAAFRGAGAVVGPLISGVGELARTVLPLLGRAFQAVAPLIAPIFHGLSGFVAAVLPALITLIHAAAPAVSALGSVLRSLGGGIAAILTGVAPGLRASSVLFAALGTIIRALAPVLAKIAVQLAIALAPAFVQLARTLVSLSPQLVILAGLFGKVLVFAITNFLAGVSVVARFISHLPGPVKLAGLAFIALGIAMRLAAAGNPWVILITAIIVAIGYLSTHTKQLKAIWDTVWGGIKRIARDAWDFIWKGFGKYLLPLLGPVGLIALGVLEVYQHWKQIWGLIKRVGQDFYNWVWRDFVLKIVAFFTNTIPHAFSVTLGWVKRNWPLLVGLLGGPLGVAVALIIKYHAQIFNVFHATWSRVVNFLTGILRDIIGFFTARLRDLQSLNQRGWSAIFGFIKSTWDNAKRIVGDAVDWVKRRVLDAWNYISGRTKVLWDGIGNLMHRGMDAGKRALAASINFVTQDLINPLIRGYNTVNNIWSGSDIAAIPVVHLARGGRVGTGWAPGRDTVHAVLSEGEFVMNPRAAAAIGYDNLHAMNNANPVYAATGGQIVAQAVRFNGHPYTWGGSPPGQFDCSSFVNMILDSLHVPVPGGWHIGQGHGPVTGTWLSSGYPRVPFNQMQPGDIFDTGSHMGFVTSSGGTGFAARSTATGTGPQRVPVSTIMRVSNGVGAVGSIPGVPGVISAVLQSAFDRYIKLLDTDIKNYGQLSDLQQLQLVKGAVGRAHLHQQQAVAQGHQYTLTAGNVASHIKPAVQAKYQAALAAASLFSGPGGGNPPGGTTGSNFANGTELYNYLLTNLFSGHRIAAAGATASIWGESNWNPFAVGTGGRGLIGWTPPGTISDAAFRGGMRTQLPAILDFVRRSGDMGAIQQMLGSRSVSDAAWIWGRRVERFGIPDVHSAGIALATQIMNSSGSAGTHSSGRGPGGGHHLARGGRVFDKGGWITEPVAGVGLRSGTPYGFALNGAAEEVVPGGGGRQVHVHLHGNVMVREEADINLIAAKLAFLINEEGFG